MGIPFHHANDHHMSFAIFLTDNMRFQDIDARIHGIGTEQQFRDEIFLLFIKLPHLVHAPGKAIFYGSIGIIALCYHLAGQFCRPVFIHVHHSLIESLVQFLLSCHNLFPPHQPVNP